jgi:hypothetical protein
MKFRIISLVAITFLITACNDEPKIKGKNANHFLYFLKVSAALSASQLEAAPTSPKPTTPATPIGAIKATPTIPAPDHSCFCNFASVYFRKFIIFRHNIKLI